MLSLFFAVAVFASTATSANPVSDYVKQPTVESMKMSPDGRLLAMIAPQSDYESMLVVLDSKTLKAVGGLKSAKQHFVGDFWWVGNQRIVIAVARKYGGLDEPFLTGRLIAVDADGSNILPLYGAEEGDQQVGTRVKTRAGENGFASMVDPMPDDSEYATIAIYPPSSELPYTELYEVNVDSASRRKIARAPIAGADFIFDLKGRPRYAFGNSNEGWHQLYLRDEEDKWALVNNEQETGLELQPLAFGKDGVYMYIRESEGPGRIAMWDPQAGEGKLVHQSKVAEPMQTLVAADRHSVYGVVTEDDRTEAVILDATSPQARSLTAIARNFKGALVLPLSWSRDGTQALIKVVSDKNSGEYYLFDRVNGKAHFLIARDEWLDPAQMRARTPVAIDARDKIKLHGYLTLPAPEAKNLPLVLVVHGGPQGVRDDWLWEPWSQLLSSRGYAVLQVNFRGSGGYGQTFEISGYRQWGGKIADDLTDATRWAVAQGYADPKRICIMGASFGGYSAMMGVVREPDLYRCAISYAGVSDLPMMFNRGDISDSKYGQRYLALALGKDKAELDRFSPYRHADRIKAEVMLIHGGDDLRVPIGHAKRMRSALEKHGKTVEWLVESNEGHGFYRAEHRLEVYERVLKFLDTNTKAL